MKKHEMVLDFTSLLDVILIILFLVLCSMNGKAQKDAEEIEDLKKQNAAYETQAAEQGEKISALEKENTELEDKLKQAQQELADLKKQYAEAVTDRDYYKTQAENAQNNLAKYMEIGGMSSTDLVAYQRFKENSAVFEISLVTLDPKDYSRGNRLTVYKNNAQIGSALIIPTDKDPQSEEETIKKIKDWVNKIFSGQVASLSSKEVFIVFKYDNGQIYLRTPQVVKNAVEHIDTLKNIKYDFVVSNK